MWRNLLIITAVASASLTAQERRSRIDVEHYIINAEINENTQTLAARAVVRFTPLEEAGNATFELNNALNISRVVDDSGRQVQASRSQQDSTVRLNFDQPLPKGKPVNMTFDYDGRLTGDEESPVYGIKFAAIHNDYAYLMYPARWFPINGYTTDRYSAELNITVAAGNRVIASGLETSQPNGDKIVYSFRFDENSFPGSIAVVSGNGKTVNSEGVTTSLYFRGDAQAMADVYGQETAKIITYFTGTFGLPPYANHGAGRDRRRVPQRVLVTWRDLPESARHRTRCEYQAAGQPDFAPVVACSDLARDPQSSLADQRIGRIFRVDLRRTYQWARGAPNAVPRHGRGGSDYRQCPGHSGGAPGGLLAGTVGAHGLQRRGCSEHAALQPGRCQVFRDSQSSTSRTYAWKSVTTEDFKKVAEAVSQENLGYFFIEWIESSGAPEFKLEYTIFRTQKGFRVMGKVSQDLDTFRMPAELKIETEGNPEEKRIEVVGTSSEFSVDTFGKPKSVTIDPDSRLLRYSDNMRVAVAIRRGEQFVEVSDFGEALKEFQKALETKRNSSLAHYRIADVFFKQNNYQSAANEFREVLNGDLDPKWTEVWSHINLGKIFDITGQRERAVNEYQLAQRTRDNTQGAQDVAAKYIKTPYERKKSALDER